MRCVLAQGPSMGVMSNPCGVPAAGRFQGARLAAGRRDGLPGERVGVAALRGAGARASGATRTGVVFSSGGRESDWDSGDEGLRLVMDG